MLIDAHLRCEGSESPWNVLRKLDQADIDLAVLLAPMPPSNRPLADAAWPANVNGWLARLVSHHRDRLAGLAVIDPRQPDAVAHVRYAIEALELDGLALAAGAWSPREPRVTAVFAQADALGVPVWCQTMAHPRELESLRTFPRLRLTLSRLGAPWCDEALAVGLVDRLRGVAPEDALLRLELSIAAPTFDSPAARGFGSPAARDRLAVVAKALATLGPRSIQFGSGLPLTASATELRGARRWVQDVFDELDVSEDNRERVFAGTAGHWLMRDAVTR